jgi:hypothetical protein
MKHDILINKIVSGSVAVLSNGTYNLLTSNGCTAYANGSIDSSCVISEVIPKVPSYTTPVAISLSNGINKINSTIYSCS